MPADSVNVDLREPRFGLTKLVAAYGAALVAVPSDFGPRLFGFVLSPSRAILVTLVIAALASGRISRRSLRELPRAVLIGWALFLASAAVSTFVSPVGGAMSRYGSLVAEGLVLFVVVAAVVETRSDVRTVALALIVSTIAVAVGTMTLGLLGGTYDGLFAKLSGATAAVAPVDARFGLVRQQGSFPAPLFFGLWLAGASPLILPYVQRSIPRVRVASLAGWILLFSAVVLVTVSRMAIAGTLAAAGAYFLLERPRWLGAAAIAASFAVAVGFASATWGVPTVDAPPSMATSPVPQSSPGLAVAPTITARPTPIKPTEAQTVAESNALRVQALRSALKAVSQRPLFGWGLLTEKDVVSEIGGSTNYVDSSYLALLVNLGLVGSGALIFLFIAVAHACWGARTSALGVSLGLSTVSILAMSSLAAFLVITQGYALTWMLAALLLRAAKTAVTPAT